MGYELLPVNVDLWSALTQITDNSIIRDGGFVAANMSILPIVQDVYVLSDVELNRLWLAWQVWATLTTAKNT